MAVEPAPQDPRTVAASFRPAVEASVRTEPPPVLPIARGPSPVALVLAAPRSALAGGTWIYASWYGPGFHGKRTACGQTFAATSWGVAHRTLPCGTVVQVTYGGQTVSVPVIDRGPYIDGRDLDLAEAVAASLGLSGVRPVYLVVP